MDARREHEGQAMGVGTTASRPGDCFIMSSEISALDPQSEDTGKKAG